MFITVSWKCVNTLHPVAAHMSPESTHMIKDLYGGFNTRHYTLVHGCSFSCFLQVVYKDKPLLVHTLDTVTINQSELSKECLDAPWNKDVLYLFLRPQLTTILSKGLSSQPVCGCWLLQLCCSLQLHLPHPDGSTDMHIRPCVGCDWCTFHCSNGLSSNVLPAC